MDEFKEAFKKMSLSYVEYVNLKVEKERTMQEIAGATPYIDSSSQRLLTEEIRVVTVLATMLSRMAARSI